MLQYWQVCLISRWVSTWCFMLCFCLMFLPQTLHSKPSSTCLYICSICIFNSAGINKNLIFLVLVIKMLVLIKRVGGLKNLPTNVAWMSNVQVCFNVNSDLRFSFSYFTTLITNIVVIFPLIVLIQLFFKQGWKSGVNVVVCAVCLHGILKR